MVTGYDDVDAVFKNGDAFSSAVLRMPEVPEKSGMTSPPG